MRFRIGWRERLFVCRLCRHRMVRFARHDADDGGDLCWGCQERQKWASREAPEAKVNRG